MSDKEAQPNESQGERRHEAHQISLRLAKHALPEREWNFENSQTRHGAAELQQYLLDDVEVIALQGQGFQLRCAAQPETIRNQ